MNTPTRASLKPTLITLSLIFVFVFCIHLILSDNIHDIDMSSETLSLNDLQSPINKLQVTPQTKGEFCFSVESDVLAQHNIILDVAGVYYKLFVDQVQISQNKDHTVASFTPAHNFFFIPHNCAKADGLSHITINYTPAYYNFSPSVYIVDNSSLVKIKFYLLIIHSAQILTYILLTLFCLCVAFLAKNKTSAGIAFLQTIICLKVCLTGYVSDVSPVNPSSFYETKHIMDMCIFTIINYYTSSYSKTPVKIISHIILVCFIAITTISIWSYHPIYTYIQAVLLIIYSIYILTRGNTDTANRNTHYYYLSYGCICIYLLLATYKAITGKLSLSLINVSNIGFILLSIVVTLKYTRHLLQQVSEYKTKEASLKKVGLLKNIGHDLKTPLTIIKTNNQILDIHSALDKEDVDMLINGTLSSITDLDRMITNINALLSEGALALNEEISLQHLFQNLHHKYNAFCISKNIELKVDIPFQDIVIKSNEVLLYRVVNNLIDNAIKYNKEQGEIQVGFILYNADMVKISISDKGIGMTKEQLDNIFTPFYRVAQSRSIAGLGLGLAVVKHLLDYLNGDVHVESKEGFGSQFDVYLHIKQQ